MEATSAFEAMEKMVQEKKLSKKINYDVLKDLNPSAFKADTIEFTQVLMMMMVMMMMLIIIIKRQFIRRRNMGRHYRAPGLVITRVSNSR